METSNPLLQRDIDFSAAGSSGAMTLNGTVNKAGVLLLLCIASAFFSWTHPQFLPAFIVIGLFGGLIFCMVGMFMPTSTPFTAPAYAICEGLVLGSISGLLDVRFPGIAANAMLLTFGVFGLMLFLYSSRIIPVTEKLVMGITMAVGAIALVYLADMLLAIFGIHVPFLHSNGPVGIAISCVIVGVAAMSLLLDFAQIEASVYQGAPKYMEWYSGMALLVTLVWLYLEILNLLLKLQGSRDDR